MELDKTSNHKIHIDKDVFEKLKRLYIIAITTIAVSIVVSQFIIRDFLNDQQNDSAIINIAGRQRMLSQKLTKEVLLISYENDLSNRTLLRENLKNSLNLWTKSHEELKNRSTDLNISGTNSIEVSEMFEAVNPYYENIVKASQNIISALEKNDNLSTLELHEYVSIVRKNESQFLILMDKVVNQYDLEADMKVDDLRGLELMIMVVTLVLLFGELVFIFWPSAKFVKKVIAKLLHSESEALKLAADADLLREQNENSVYELRKLNDLIDKTLLFARVKTDGTVIYVGDKFSQFFKMSRFSKGMYFSEIISTRKSERETIDTILSSNNNRSGWQGEVKVTKKDNENAWLEMHIIPFKGNYEKSEFLIVASDITKRKRAQIDLENLTNERYEEKMNQQKVITSKIIENQEKEQDRIAKDMHDGIGQMLTGLKYNLESVNPEHTEKTIVKIEYLKELVTNIIKGVRTATFNLTPPELGDYGVVPALVKLTKELNKYTDKQVVFYNKTNFDVRLDSLVEINIYRVVQEAVNNAIKYAGSSHIIVAISHSEKLLSIIIDDNGTGFNEDEMKDKNISEGMGMIFMKERMKYVNGRIFINSSKENGTRITLNIPI
ncbi:Histidine kinase [Tenacibaculum sp. MAR_2009_124]|uniref:sensor histidine kinase n=1 Tax=Tenacibaculum sp. MAR_2009_124 TaxID=1250059 RepID=UPI00089895A0|nr:type IV pili methyl-accepting chemotaxis transducer N-terminal domain-containing protein [Tenacibaculum sp. MAR_2009_124]SEC23370.1 Histidine kinase [Tenacibaculum sp. MAR_2009_124]